MSLGSFTWIVNLEYNKRQYSQHFTIKDVANVAFNLSAVRDHDKHFTVEVQKGFHESARAVITIWLENGSSATVKTGDWKNTCVFRDLPMPSLEFQRPLTNNFHDCDAEIVSEYTVKITCEILWHGFVKALPSYCHHYNFHDFIFKPEYSDALIDINGVELPVHKIILAAQSPVFLEMFAASTTTKNVATNRIEINDIDLDTMKEVIGYLYTGNIKATSDINLTLSLLGSAERFQLIKLKNICETRLLQDVNIDNAVRIVSAADDYNALELRQKVIEFMVRNKRRILMLPDFKELCNSKPAVLFDFVVIVVNEK